MPDPTSPPADGPHLVVERRGAASWIRLTRPEKRNAITRAMAGRFRDALLFSAADDEDVRVVVVTGSGGFFCSGADTRDLFEGGGAGAAGAAMLTERRSSSTPVFPVDELVLCPKPTIALVNGPAVGGGATMAMAADLRVCAASATLAFTLGRMGLTPEWGSSYLLWRQIGWSRALDVLLTGRTLDADEALALGLVSRVAPDDLAEAVVDELVEAIAALPPGTAEGIKDVLRAGLDSTYPDARRYELRTLTRRGDELAAWRRRQKEQDQQ